PPPPPTLFPYTTLFRSFTHDGDLCTFEVLMSRLSLDDRGLVPIAEIVHDIDLKDAKFNRPEVSGIERLIAGIAMGHRDDESRLEDRKSTRLNSSHDQIS